MKLKIASVVMAVAILILGVAIYKLHTKEDPAPVIVVTPAPEPIKPKPPEPIKPVDPEPVIVVIPVVPLEIKEAFIIRAAPRK